MMELLALERGDGWAFVREGSEIRFLRPPYASARPVSEAVVARAVTEHGFTPSGRVFRTMAELVAFLRQEIVQVGREEGRTLPAEGLWRSMLRVAPASGIARFLDRIRTELIPQRQYSQAEDMLVEILDESPTVKADANLRDRVIGLLKDVRVEQKRLEDELTASDQRSDEARFPTLAAGGHLAAARGLQEGVARRRSMYAFAGGP